MSACTDAFEESSGRRSHHVAFIIVGVVAAVLLSSIGTIPSNWLPVDQPYMRPFRPCLITWHCSANFHDLASCNRCNASMMQAMMDGLMELCHASWRTPSWLSSMTLVLAGSLFLSTSNLIYSLPVLCHAQHAHLHLPCWQVLQPQDAQVSDTQLN